MSILSRIQQDIAALRQRATELLDPEKAIVAKVEELVHALVDKAHELEQRIIELESQKATAPEPSTAIPSATSTSEAVSAPVAPEQAQPAVAENTGSGAAASAPEQTPASAGASLSPDAAGTASQTPEA